MAAFEGSAGTKQTTTALHKRYQPADLLVSKLDTSCKHQHIELTYP
jgi:hypothetical protein